MSDVPALALPDQPSLEQLRKQAKDLRRAEGIGLSAAQLAVCPAVRPVVSRIRARRTWTLR